MALTYGLTKLQIINRALALAGTQTVTQAQLDAGSTPNAVRANELVEPAAKIVLRDHDWATATVIKDYDADDGTTSDLHFTYALTLPDDYVRMVGLRDSSGNYIPADRWKVIKDKLHTDAEDIFMEYIALPDDYSELDILIGDCIAYRLAVDLAHAVKQDPKLYNQLIKTYVEYILPNARQQDTMEDKEGFVEGNQWDTARINIGA
jgi:hypothetical protein